MNCPLCERGDDESRAQAQRRVEELAFRKPTAKNKQRARLGRACFEPWPERLSKIFFLCEAQREMDDMDLGLFGIDAPLGDPDWLLSPQERAKKNAADGVRIAPPIPWWILANA